MDMHKAFLNTSSCNGVRWEGMFPAIQTLPGGSSYCFYCWGSSHWIADCNHVKADVQKGWVILVDGKTRMPNRSPLPREPSNVSPHDHIVKLNEKAVGMFFGWPTEDDPETPTFSTCVNATRDTRDDMLECIKHSESDRLGNWKKGSTRWLKSSVCW